MVFKGATGQQKPTTVHLFLHLHLHLIKTFSVTTIYYVSQCPLSPSLSTYRYGYMHLRLNQPGSAVKHS